MTPELQHAIDTVISKEYRMNLIEHEHMAIDQLEGYQGEKRKHRYNSRWRNESAICMINFVIDHYGYRPMISIQYVSSAAPASYAEGIRAIVMGYDDLKQGYIELSRQALKDNHDELLQVAQSKIGWISKTRMKYARDLRETANKSSDYLQLRSEYMHEKYRKKESEFRIEY
jgi:hypothetical protein